MFVPLEEVVGIFDGSLTASGAPLDLGDMTEVRHYKALGPKINARGIEIRHPKSGRNHLQLVPGQSQR
jgi:hypothetical protein